MRTPPNDQRFFLHKRLLGAAKSFVTSGFNPLSAATGFISSPRQRRAGRTLGVPTGPQSLGLSRSLRRAIAITGQPTQLPVRRPVARTLTARPDATSAAEKNRGRIAKFSSELEPVLSIKSDLIDFIQGGDKCRIPGMVWDEVNRKCVFGLGEQAGRDDTPIGDVVMGRYGAGEMPGNMVVNRAICRPGMVVGDDGVCYNRTQIRNSQREWPRGRRPLLTGGDMRAISVAARAGKRLERTTKRLQKIGLMKKAAPRRQITAASVHHAK